MGPDRGLDRIAPHSPHPPTPQLSPRWTQAGLAAAEAAASRAVAEGIAAALGAQFCSGTSGHLWRPGPEGSSLSLVRRVGSVIKSQVKENARGWFPHLISRHSSGLKEKAQVARNPASPIYLLNASLHLRVKTRRSAGALLVVTCNDFLGSLQGLLGVGMGKLGGFCLASAP